MANPRIEINDASLLEGLRRLQGQLRDLTSVMRQLSEIMIAASQKAFERRADPSTGAVWTPLSTSRQRQRARKGCSQLKNGMKNTSCLKGWRILATGITLSSRKTSRCLSRS